MPASITKALVNGLLLAAAAFVAYLLGNHPDFSKYSLQAVALCAILYLLGQIVIKFLFPKLAKLRTTFSLSLLTLAVFLVIFSTGATASPVFFLLYFLIFSCSLLLEPASALVLSFTAVVLFLILPMNDLLAEMLQLSSLFLITPLALIIGRQYIKMLNNETKIEVLQNQGEILSEEIKDQQEKVKSWTYQDLARDIVQIQEGIKSLLDDPRIPSEEKNHLKKLFSKAYRIFESGKELDKKIEA